MKKALLGLLLALLTGGVLTQGQQLDLRSNDASSILISISNVSMRLLSRDVVVQFDLGIGQFSGVVQKIAYTVSGLRNLSSDPNLPVVETFRANRLSMNLNASGYSDRIEEVMTDFCEHAKNNTSYSHALSIEVEAVGALSSRVYRNAAIFTSSIDLAQLGC